jgi:hypothetical protein
MATKLYHLVDFIFSIENPAFERSKRFLYLLVDVSCIATEYNNSKLRKLQLWGEGLISTLPNSMLRSKVKQL